MSYEEEDTRHFDVGTPYSAADAFSHTHTPYTNLKPKP
jgi:hypothetical protein